MTHNTHVTNIIKDKILINYIIHKNFKPHPISAAAEFFFCFHSSNMQKSKAHHRENPGHTHTSLCLFPAFQMWLCEINLSPGAEKKYI